MKFSAKITGAPRLFPLPTPEKNCFFWGGEGRDLANEIDSCQFIFWLVTLSSTFFHPFAPGDFAEKRVLKLVEWFSGHCRAIKS